MTGNQGESSKMRKALGLLREGRGGEGEALLGELIEGDGTPAGERLAALGHRGHHRMAGGRHEEALADYREVMALSPEDPHAVALTARLLLLSGAAAEAIPMAGRALAMDPSDVYSTETIRIAQEALGHGAAGEAGGARVPPLPIPEAPFNPVLKALEEDPASSFPTSIHPELGRFIYTVIRAIKPTLVVETGSYIGYSGICIAQALEDNGRGHLHCFDLFGGVAGGEKSLRNYTSPILGRKGTFLEIARGHLEEAGLSHRATCHAGDSSSTIRGHFAANPAKVQCAFIDGDHTIRGCLKDWEAVEEILDEDGFVILHDTIAEGSGWRGPAFLLQELEAKAWERYQCLQFPTFDRLGLAIIQKRAPAPAPRFRPTLGELLAERLFHNLKHGRRK